MYFSKSRKWEACLVLIEYTILFFREKRKISRGSQFRKVQDTPPPTTSYAYNKLRLRLAGRRQTLLLFLQLSLYLFPTIYIFLNGVHVYIVFRVLNFCSNPFT